MEPAAGLRRGLCAMLLTSSVLATAHQGSLVLLTVTGMTENAIQHYTSFMLTTVDARRSTASVRPHAVLIHMNAEHTPHGQLTAAAHSVGRLKSPGTLL
ncbi:hypothetical protein DENSPDRAFT_200261 [Dentipellis sp. KUC8613]|nr:hypothetical protein DENSPDRAFT_200261 [Dentipellis sp. KUC8613]